MVCAGALHKTAGAGGDMTGYAFSIQRKNFLGGKPEKAAMVATA